MKAIFSIVFTLFLSVCTHAADEPLQPTRHALGRLLVIQVVHKGLKKYQFTDFVSRKVVLDRSDLSVPVYRVEKYPAPITRRNYIEMQTQTQLGLLNIKTDLMIIESDYKGFYVMIRGQYMQDQARPPFYETTQAETFDLKTQSMILSEDWSLISEVVENGKKVFYHEQIIVKTTFLDKN